MLGQGHEIEPNGLEAERSFALRLSSPGPRVGTFQVGSLPFLPFRARHREIEGDGLPSPHKRTLSNLTPIPHINHTLSH